MKSFAIIFACVLVACLWSEANGDCPPYPSGLQGNVLTGSTVVVKCAEFTCQADGSWTSSGCALSACRDQIGETPYNYTAPYPECCPRPICKSDSS